MAQFMAYRNTNPVSKGAAPLLLDVQSDLFADLDTRVVVPLCPAATMKGKVMQSLTPPIEIDEKHYVMLTPQIAGIARRTLGTPAADLSHHRHEIIAALDLLITGF